ncbi:unnamed protein product, partial [Musa acuminata var. zebrina]
SQAILLCQFVSKEKRAEIAVVVVVILLSSFLCIFRDQMLSIKDIASKANIFIGYGVRHYHYQSRSLLDE